MQRHEVEREIALFLVKIHGIEAGTFTSEDEIFSSGAVDSFATLELTIFIEDKFSVQVDEEQIFSLGSLSKTAAHIVQVASSRGQAA